jgi:hypothetical protein
VQDLKDAAADAINRNKTADAKKKHEEIIVLIEAALRHGQSQPWMYEVLAISMKIADRPQADIDRAIMSAAEFTQNSGQLMQLGAYLVQAKMKSRALKIFHEVSQIEPFWAEPYMHGMTVARDLKDVEGLEWSTAGILGQAWPPEQFKIWEDAARVAESELIELREQKRNDEAKHFEANLNQAMARDCIVRVIWNGDADIDVMIKEPAGTICSLRNPRTTSGGMLIGDVPSPDGKEKVQGHIAVYSCPKAFSGNYQVLIRRVFGNVPTGNVKVIVNTHYNTTEAKETVWEKIPVKEGESLVKFDLGEGRRKESVREAQIVNAAVATIGQHRQNAILAQQLAQLNDPTAVNAQAAAVQQSAAAAAAAAQAQLANPLGAFPNAFRGAVGYQPVIVTLPEGTNMSATGVVSADRRYVRITCVPVFSAISQVHTFSIANGNTQNTPGIGTGGNGFSGASSGAGGLGGGGLGGGGLGGGGLGGGGLGGGGLGGGGGFF